MQGCEFDGGGPGWLWRLRRGDEGVEGAVAEDCRG